MRRFTLQDLIFSGSDISGGGFGGKIITNNVVGSNLISSSIKCSIFSCKTVDSFNIEQISVHLTPQLLFDLKYSTWFKLVYLTQVNREPWPWSSYFINWLHQMILNIYRDFSFNLLNIRKRLTLSLNFLAAFKFNLILWIFSVFQNYVQLVSNKKLTTNSLSN